MSERLARYAWMIEGQAARFSLLIAGIWLFFLIEPALNHRDELTRPGGAAAYVALLVFCGTYLTLFELLRRRRANLEMSLPLRQAWFLVGLMLFCALVILVGWGQDGVGTTVFIAVSAAMALPAGHALVFIPLMAMAVVVWTATAPGWERNFSMPMVAVSAGMVMWGVKQLMTSNVELIVMREENESLLVDQERNRFARDLHDILGHSLTVIAVKAELAGRLLENRDAEGAAREIRQLERLSRDALSDVRHAVEGYREITLPGEVARARTALEAAGITAVLPSSTDDVPGPLRELFAWTIREGVTNVIRHGESSRCAIELTADRVVVRNDLPSGSERTRVNGSSVGNGLRGIKERAEASGARMLVHSSPEEGFVLEVVGSR